MPGEDVAPAGDCAGYSAHGAGSCRGSGSCGGKADGVNLLPLLRGSDERAPHQDLFWRYDNAVALRQGDWKLVRQPSGPRATPGAYELYNLAADIGETRNLAAAEPGRAAAMLARLEAINGEMKAPLW